MEGLIKIEKFRVHCVIGAKPFERETEQEISIDLELKVNLAEAVQTDSIVDTVDYSQVALACQNLAKTRRYHLLETFAYEALHEILTEFPVTWVKIVVSKKQGIPLAKSTSIELEKAK